RFPCGERAERPRPQLRSWPLSPLTAWKPPSKSCTQAPGCSHQPPSGRGGRMVPPPVPPPPLPPPVCPPPAAAPPPAAPPPPALPPPLPPSVLFGGGGHAAKASSAIRTQNRRMEGLPSWHIIRPGR